MTDIDTILSMVNNPTRRKILQALVREPHYPLQLSKEIGVSQQAIMKNLDLLERNGMVVSHHEISSIGPMRTVYEPTSEFTLVIDMRGCMFTARMIAGEGEEDDLTVPETDNLDQVRQEIAEIDAEIEELDRERSALMHRRERMIASSLSRLDSEEFEYAHRNLLYNLLNHPEVPIEDIVSEMAPGRKQMRQTVADIERSMSQQ